MVIGTHEWLGEDVPFVDLVHRFRTGTATNATGPGVVMWVDGDGLPPVRDLFVRDLVTRHKRRSACRRARWWRRNAERVRGIVAILGTAAAFAAAHMWF